MTTAMNKEENEQESREMVELLKTTVEFLDKGHTIEPQSPWHYRLNDWKSKQEQP